MAKLNYMKPLLQFNPIALQAGTSGGCTFNSTSGESVCVVESQGVKFFQESTEGCTYKPLPGMEQSICYYVPTADTNIYSS